MLHPLHSRYVPDPSKEAIFVSNSHQHVQWTQGELGSSAVIFLHFESLYGGFMSTGFFKARAWGGDILLKLYTEWKIFHINVNSYTLIACYDCISFYRLCGRLLNPSAFVCLPTCLTQAIWWTTLVWCAWFPGSYSWSRRAHSSATACFFRNTGTTSINFPVCYHRWWSNFCEFQGQENTTGLSSGLEMFISCTGGRPSCLVLFVKEIKTRRHTHLLDFRD